ASRRWRAIRLLRLKPPAVERAVALIDRADAATPEVRGFIDGQEFIGLRDADDRFASVLEAIAGREYVWFPWEAVRRVELSPAGGDTLDRLFRPATVKLRTGEDYPVRLPRVYPGSPAAAGGFAAGLGTRRVC